MLNSSILSKQLDYFNLRYDLFETNCVLSKNLNDFQKLYSFWEKSWNDAFKEIDTKLQVTPDEFLRHKFASGIFHNGEYIACALIGEFLLNNPVHAQHSYFRNHPPHVMEKLKILSENQPLLTFGYLSVSPDFRGQFGLSDTLLGLALTAQNYSQHKILISHTRNTRKTNELTYRLGAKPIAIDAIMHGEPCDYVYFEKQSQRALAKNKFFDQINFLWNTSETAIEFYKFKTQLKGKNNYEPAILSNL